MKMRLRDSSDHASLVKKPPLRRQSKIEKIAVGYKNIRTERTTSSIRNVGKAMDISEIYRTIDRNPLKRTVRKL